MYKALNYWVFGGFSPAKTPYEFIDFVHGQGLDGAEITVGDCLDVNAGEEECRKIAAYAKERNVGLRTLATGAGWGKWLTSDDAAERREAADFVRRYLQLAAWLGAESVLVVPGATRVAWDGSHAPVSYARAWENATQELRALLGDAERLGVNIALENVWNRFLVSPMEWKLFLDQFDSDRIGIYLDVGNCQIVAPASDYVEALGKYVKAVHLKNWRSEDCAGGLHGFGDSMLEGDVDYRSVFDALAAIGYDGPFTAEMIPFSRLPDLVLPDQELAEKTARELKTL